MRKEGAGFDLPMALGILGAMGMVGGTEQHLFIGELSLDGSIRPVRGALSVAACARRQGIRNLLVPIDNAAEASVAEGVSVYGMRHLSEVVKFLADPNAFVPVDAKAAFHAGTSVAHSRFCERCAARQWRNELSKLRRLERITS